VAADLDGGIGKDNGLPWPRLATDLRTFKRLTTTAVAGRRNAVIMGRLTWESIPERLRPLPARQNIVISHRDPAVPHGVWRAHSLDEALKLAASDPGIDRVFVIGGGQIYAQAFQHAGCVEVILTRLEARFACDTFIPPLDSTFVRAEELARAYEGGVDYRIERWVRSA